MGGLIKFILIVIIASYLIRKVGGFFLKLFFPQVTNRHGQRKTRGTYDDEPTVRTDHKNGIKISYVRKDKKGKPFNSDAAEDVDYEEVD